MARRRAIMRDEHRRGAMSRDCQQCVAGLDSRTVFGCLDAVHYKFLLGLAFRAVKDVLDGPRAGQTHWEALHEEAKIEEVGQWRWFRGCGTTHGTVRHGAQQIR